MTQCLHFFARNPQFAPGEVLMNWACVRLLLCEFFCQHLDMPPAQDGQVSEATSSRSAVKTAVGTWGERGLDVPSGHLGVPSSAERAL